LCQRESLLIKSITTTNGGQIWSKVIREGKFELELVKRLDHVDQSSERGLNISSAITCILPMPQTVYTGDEDGRVVSQVQHKQCRSYILIAFTVSMGLHTETSCLVPRVVEGGETIRDRLMVPRVRTGCENKSESYLYVKTSSTVLSNISGLR